MIHEDKSVPVKKCIMIMTLLFEEENSSKTLWTRNILAVMWNKNGDNTTKTDYIEERNLGESHMLWAFVSDIDIHVILTL